MGFRMGFEQGVSKGVPPGVPKRVPPGVSKRVPQGVPPGVPKGVPQGVPKGVPQGVPKGVSQGVPKEVSQGVPFEIPGAFEDLMTSVVAFVYAEPVILSKVLYTKHSCSGTLLGDKCHHAMYLHDGLPGLVFVSCKSS